MRYPYALAEIANNLTRLRGDRIVCQVFLNVFVSLTLP